MIFLPKNCKKSKIYFEFTDDHHPSLLCFCFFFFSSEIFSNFSPRFFRPLNAFFCIIPSSLLPSWEKLPRTCAIGNSCENEGELNKPGDSPTLQMTPSPTKTNCFFYNLTYPTGHATMHRKPKTEFAWMFAFFFSARHMFKFPTGGQRKTLKTTHSYNGDLSPNVQHDKGIKETVSVKRN